MSRADDQTPRVLLWHLSGNPNSRNAARAFAEAGFGLRVVSGWSFARPLDQSPWFALLPAGLRARLARMVSRRMWNLAPGVEFHRYARREIARTMGRRAGLLDLLGIDEMRLVDRNTRRLDQTVAKRHLRGVDVAFSYEDHACSTFERAKRTGVRCFYELPIVHHRLSRAIMAEENERHPQFAKALLAIHEPQWKIDRKDRELELADHVFVASEMVKRSAIAAGYPEGKISLIPYGAPIESFHPRPRQTRGFTALFVGLVGPRKGAHYLLEAWKDLGLTDSRLRMVGALEFPRDWFAANIGTAEYTAHVPHPVLKDIYADASVFVLPTLVEGSAMVILEALSCGLPVIATPNAGGVVRDGVEGFIVPLRDVDALKERLQWCHDHPDELAEMGIRARQRAEELSWGNYRRRLAARVSELLAGDEVPPAMDGDSVEVESTR